MVQMHLQMHSASENPFFGSQLKNTGAIFVLYTIFPTLCKISVAALSSTSGAAHFQMNEFIRSKDAAGAINLALTCNDPFALLGINPEEFHTINVDKNYRRVSLLIHPNNTSSPQANDAFVNIGKAKVRATVIFQQIV